MIFTKAFLRSFSVPQYTSSLSTISQTSHSIKYEKKKDKNMEKKKSLNNNGKCIIM